MTENCKICGKQFKTYPSKILLGRGIYCSKECAKVTLIKKGQRISPATEIKKGQQLALGIGRSWVWNKDTKGICGRNSGSFKSGEHPSLNTEFKKGTPIYLHPRWQGGKSFEPYPLGWNKTFKEQIRYRDGYKCQLCGVSETEHGRRMSVHHIDYDKINLFIGNLICLCTNCHCKTNTSREYWKQYLKEVMLNVRKGDQTAGQVVGPPQGSANRSF
jgi:hypothetical protein